MTFTVLRVGDGEAAWTNAATAAFLQTLWVSDGSPVFPEVALPTAASGANAACTFSGTATSEGQISRSDDGHYVVAACYDAAPATSSVASSASSTVNRVVARMSAAGAVDTSTRLNAAFSGNNVRGAASVDGTSFYVSGNSASSGGVWWIPLGTTGGSQILTTPSNTRSVHVQGGQLYVDSGASNVNVVHSVGSGTPTTIGQVATALYAFATGLSPYSDPCTSTSR